MRIYYTFWGAHRFVVVAVERTCCRGDFGMRRLAAENGDGGGRADDEAAGAVRPSSETAADSAGCGRWCDNADVLLLLDGLFDEPRVPPLMLVLLLPPAAAVAVAAPLPVVLPRLLFPVVL